MITVTFWIYPILARIFTSIIVVISTEIVKQCLFYSMILPLAFVDIMRAQGPLGGLVKAIIFFLSRNIVKYTVIFADRRAIQQERENVIREKKLNAEQMKKEADDETGNEDGDEEEIPIQREDSKAKGMEVVYEDEITDLTYYGQLILALGGHGVPGWVFILRIEGDVQFWIAAVGSLIFEASVTVSIKGFQTWLEKRKQRNLKAAEAAKKKENEVRKTTFNRSSNMLARKGAVSPNVHAFHGKANSIKTGGLSKSHAAGQALFKNSQTYQNSKDDVYDPSKASAESRIKYGQSQLKVAANSNLANSNRKSLVSLNNNDKINKINEKTKEAINNIAIAAFHQDNRRMAIERRFSMCSTYSSIIGAAVVYLISITGDPNQKLCEEYGLVMWDMVLWRAFVVLFLQFLVDWWFTTSQIFWGLPFAFTTQIQITFTQGFIVASLAIVQSMTVLMAHERGLFGACKVSI